MPLEPQAGAARGSHQLIWKPFLDMRTARTAKPSRETPQRLQYAVSISSSLKRWPLCPEAVLRTISCGNQKVLPQCLCWPGSTWGSSRTPPRTGFLLPLLNVGVASALHLLHSSFQAYWPATSPILSWPPTPLSGRNTVSPVAFPSGHLKTPLGKTTPRTSRLPLSCLAFP